MHQIIDPIHTEMAFCDPSNLIHIANATRCILISGSRLLSVLLCWACRFACSAILASKKVLSVHVCETIRRGHLAKSGLPVISRASISVVATVRSLVACSTQFWIVRTLVPGLKFPTSQSDEINVEICFLALDQFRLLPKS